MGASTKASKPVLPPVVLSKDPPPALLVPSPLGGWEVWAGQRGFPVSFGGSTGRRNENVSLSSSLKATVPHTFLSLWVGKT